jgi:long-subunit fatty acid transport protein
MARSHRGCLFLFASLVVTTPSPAGAQASLQVPLQFDFLNPGARSLAMGSAFTGLADDATAAFTNPAGLTWLVRPEISIEGRYRSITTPFLEGGRLFGTLTNIRDDVVSGPLYGESDTSAGGVSFLSVVIPRGRSAIALYRHELVKIRDGFTSRGVFQDVVTSTGRLVQTRELPLEAARNVDIVNYGFSAAHRLNDRVSIGGGISIYQFSLESTFRRFATSGEDIFGPPNFSQEVFRVTQDGDDVGVGFGGGFQWTVHPKVRIGAVYRHSPDFDVRLEEALSATVREGTFQVPDAVSAGVMVRPTEALTLAFDYAFVRYSGLEDDFVTIQTGTRPENFRVDDGHEVHAGLEYVFTNLSAVPAIRFGTWYDPDHSVRYEPTAASDAFDVRFAATLPGGDDLVHFTLGGGVSITSRFEINAAADLTSKRKTFATSAVYRF